MVSRINISDGIDIYFRYKKEIFGIDQSLIDNEYEKAKGELVIIRKREESRIEQMMTFDLDNLSKKEFQILEKYSKINPKKEKRLTLDEYLSYLEKAEKIIKEGREKILNTWLNEESLRPFIAKRVLEILSKK